MPLLDELSGTLTTEAGAALLLESEATHEAAARRTGHSMITPGSTSQSVTVQILDDAGLAVTGLVAATFPATKYKKAGPFAEVPITLSDLALMTTAYTSGGVKESSGGYYRLDVPDAAFSTTARVTLIGDASGKHMIAPLLDVQTLTTNATLAPVATGTTAVPGGSLNLGVSAVNFVGYAISLAGGPPSQILTGLSNGEVTTNPAIGSGAGTAWTVYRLFVPPNVATVPDVPTANANADALLDRANGIETGYTLRQVMRLISAVFAGKSSSAGGTYRDLNDTKNRVTATLDTSGDRTAVTRDAT